MSSLRSVLRFLDGRLGALVATLAGLRVLQRVATASVAWAWVANGRGRALVASGVLAALYGARAILAASVRHFARERLHREAVAAILEGDPLRSVLLERDDPQIAVFEGIHFGTSLIAEHVPDMVGDAVACLAGTVFLAFVEPAPLLIVGGLALALGASATLFSRRLTARVNDRIRSHYRAIIDAVLASIGGRLEIVASGRATEFIGRFTIAIGEWRRSASRAGALSATAGRLPFLAAVAVVATALLVDRSLRGEMASAGLVDAALFASVVPAFAGLTRALHEAVTATLKFRPLASLMAMHVHRAPSGELPPALPAPIRWSRVSFAYPLPNGTRGPLVMDDVTIDWGAGSLLVLEGPNGSGKSTCLRLLLALGPPSSGKVYVGDRDLATFDPQGWRQAIAYLPQRPFQPERGSVRDALRLIVTDAGDEALRRVLERVELWKALAASRGSAPLDVLVSTLSAGQRQRVALARVLLREDARIFLLDEPDANLDSAGVALVAKIIRDLAKDHMVAVVAHTDAIFAVADQRVSLDRVAPTPLRDAG